ncbi:hypothetical protein ACP4OV_021341 [Aristida adscensionis]
MEEMVYIAVGKDYNSEKRNLLFVLRQFPGPVGILHVHSRSKLIPVLGARVPEKFAKADVKEHHWRREKEKMLKLLRSYAVLCSEREVKFQYITSEDTLLGLQQLVLNNQVRRLVIASRSMSKENALLQFCQILLVRNGRHEWTSPATPQWTPGHLTEESDGYIQPRNEMVDKSSELDEDETADGVAPNTTGDTPSSSNEDSRDISEDNNWFQKEAVFGHDQDIWITLPEETPNSTYYPQGHFEGPNASENLLDDHSVHEKIQVELLMAKVKELERKLHFLEEEVNLKEEKQSRPQEPSEQEVPYSHCVNPTTRRKQYRQSPINVIEYSNYELRQATDNFHHSKKIGQGGFGPVYRGKLQGRLVAIKMFNPRGRQGYFEFEQEALILSSVRHPNIVKLLGLCSESMALVYEYLSNNSLERSLRVLSWQDRVRIIQEVRSALMHLHFNKPYAIVHSDIKPANILLGENNISRLGDFGTARLLRQDPFGRKNVSRMTMPMGTTGYMDPVYLNTQMLSTQADIYSFGVIILQLLTGWESVTGITDKVEKWIRYKECSRIILDDNAGNWPYPEAEQLLWVALQCCDCDEPKRRPSLTSGCWRVLDLLNAKAEKI